MADTKTTPTSTNTVLATVAGVAISLAVLYGIVYFASKAWKKGQAA